MYNRSNSRINYFQYLHRSEFQSINSPFFFAYGRTALKYGLLAYDIPKGKKILIPNYICEALTTTINTIGIDVSYYSVNKDLSPDWKSVNESLSKDVVAIVMVHYFGIAQNINAFVHFAKENNLLLIEDNSHGYGGMHKNELLGTYGDIGISSPRKSFPILNGGVLYLKDKKNISIPYLPLEPVNTIKLIIRDITGRILDNNPSVKAFFLNQSPQETYDYDSKVKDWSIDKASNIMLAKYDLEIVQTHRISLYRVWEKWSKKNGLTPLFTLINNTFSPISMPLIFENKKDRDKYLDIFKKNHIAVYLWPFLPKEISKTVNSGSDLYEKALFLPIHLSMKASDLENFLSKKFKH